MESLCCSLVYSQSSELQPLPHDESTTPVCVITYMYIVSSSLVHQHEAMSNIPLSVPSCVH